MELYDLPEDHDIAHLRAAMALCRNFRTAIDAGAHRGIWTREMRRRFQTVWSIEPVIDNARFIDGEHLIRAALSDRPGWTVMQAGPENTGQWHIDPEAKSGPVRVETLDRLMGAFQTVDLLKLDVEGNELAVLRGGEALIDRDRPVICLEINGLHRRYGVADGHIEAWMGAKGYRLAARCNKDYLWTP